MDEQTKREIARLLIEQVLIDAEEEIREIQKAQQVVLQILKSQKSITFDARDALDETWREFIRGEG